MATTSSLGVGTGVDLQSMLSKIMTAESAPLVALGSKIAATNSKISLFGTLKSKLDALQSAADTLQYPSRLSATAATSSDSGVVGASASHTAAIGTYATEVTQLANAQKSFSNAYSAGTTFGPGDLNFTVGGVAAPTITLNGQASYTLQEVGTAINNANVGVTATVITASDGTQRMVLTGNKSGENNDFALTSTLTPSAGTSLDSFDETTVGLKRALAQDAKMTIDGIEISSNTNTFSSAVTGLTLTAVKLGTSTVTVQSDSSKITSAAQAFVDSYNAVVSLIKSNSAYNTSTKTGQSFNGESATRSILSTLSDTKAVIPAGLSSSFSTLSELGISVDQNGLLTLDSAKLNTAIGTSATDVVTTLGAYGKAFSDVVIGMSNTGGVLSNRVNGLNSAVAGYQDNQSLMQSRIALIEKRYRAQFTALDTLVSSMQTISSALTQQLATLPKNA